MWLSSGGGLLRAAAMGAIVGTVTVGALCTIWLDTDERRRLFALLPINRRAASGL
jgi:hypothetical protein